MNPHNILIVKFPSDLTSDLTFDLIGRSMSYYNTYFITSRPSPQHVNTKTMSKAIHFTTGVYCKNTILVFSKRTLLVSTEPASIIVVSLHKKCFISMLRFLCFHDALFRNVSIRMLWNKKYQLFKKVITSVYVQHILEHK